MDPIDPPKPHQMAIFMTSFCLFRGGAGVWIGVEGVSGVCLFFPLRQSPAISPFLRAGHASIGFYIPI